MAVMNEMASEIVVYEDRLHGPARETNLVLILVQGTSYAHSLICRTIGVLA